MTEVVIGLFVLAVFLTPLLRNFTAVRRFSLAARDTVTATALALSCLAELRGLPYAALRPDHPDLLARMRPYAATRVGNVAYRTLLTGIEEALPGRVKVLHLQVEFTLPGEPNAPRSLPMRGFVHAPLP